LYANILHYFLILLFFYFIYVHIQFFKPNLINLNDFVKDMFLPKNCAAS